MNKYSIERKLISQIRFGFHGARVLARNGHHGYARQYRAACRRQIAELRALRAEVGA
ncbi:MAG TPA: hypothetical protein VFK31_09565 [Rhodanobacteraceae bacterium]|nr:hypothetical protein [Rhodanobacteraceae bacterium]